MGDFHPGNIALNPGKGAFKWVWIDYADTEKLPTVSMSGQCKQFKKIFLERLVQELGTPHQAIGAEFRCVFQSHSDSMYTNHVDCAQVDFKIADLDKKFKEVIRRKTIASAVGHVQPAPSLTQATSEGSAAVVKSGAFLTSGNHAPPWQNITQAPSAVSAGVVKTGGTSPISVDRSRGIAPPAPWNRHASAVGHMQPAPSLTQATSEGSAAVVKSGAFPTSGNPAPPMQNITQASSAVSAGVVKTGGTSPPPPPWNRQSHGIWARDNEHGASSNSVQPPCAEESESKPVEDFIAVIHAKNDEHGALSTSLPEALVPSSRAEESGADVQNKAGGALSTSLPEGLMRPSRAEESGAPSEESVPCPDEHGAPPEESVPCPGGRYSFF